MPHCVICVIKVRVIIRATWKFSNKAEFVVSWEALWSRETGTPAASGQACHMADLLPKRQLLLRKNYVLLLAMTKWEEKSLPLSKYKEISKYEIIPLSWLMGKIESFGFSPVNSKIKQQRNLGFLWKTVWICVDWKTLMWDDDFRNRWIQRMNSPHLCLWRVRRNDAFEVSSCRPWRIWEWSWKMRLLLILQVLHDKVIYLMSKDCLDVQSPKGAEARKKQKHWRGKQSSLHLSLQKDRCFFAVILHNVGETFCLLKFIHRKVLVSCFFSQ